MCNINDERRKIYDEYYKIQNDRIKSNIESQDKMIISCSTAFFGLLPFIIEKLLVKKIFLYLLFTFNVITLICVLLSFWFCYKGNVKDLVFAEECYLNNNQNFCNKKSKWTSFGELMNVCSMFFMICTFVCFAIILFQNTTRMEQVSNQNKTHKIQDGVPSAKPIPTTKPLGEGVVSAPMKPVVNNPNPNDTSKPTPNTKNPQK